VGRLKRALCLPQAQLLEQAVSDTSFNLETVNIKIFSQCNIFGYIILKYSK
jgi:hypothetical protein